MGVLAGLGIATRLAWLTIQPSAPEQRIDWDAIEGCPSPAAVVEATDEYLGRPLANYPRAVTADARVVAAPTGYRVRLGIEVDGRREQHEFAAVDCDQLGRDVALLIASAVDPFALGPPPTPVDRQLWVTPVVVQRPRTIAQVGPTPRPVITTPAITPATSWRPLVPSELVDTPEPREHRPERPVAGSLAVAGTGFAGLFPRVGGGVAIEGGLDRGLLRWQIGAAGWFGGQFRALDSNVGANLWAVSGSTGLCVAPGRRRFDFAACAIVGTGPIVTTSVGTQTAGTLVRPWAFAGPDLRASFVPNPRIAVYLGVSVLPALVRPAWSVRDPDASFRVPPVAGMVRLGIELRNLGAG